MVFVFGQDRCKWRQSNSEGIFHQCHQIMPFFFIWLPDEKKTTGLQPQRQNSLYLIKKGQEQPQRSSNEGTKRTGCSFQVFGAGGQEWDLLPACQLVFIHPIFNFRVMTATLDTTSMYNNFSRFQLLSWLLRRRVVDAKVLPGTPYLHQSTTAQLLFQVEDLPPCLNRSLELKSSFLGGNLIVLFLGFEFCISCSFCILYFFVDIRGWNHVAR